MATCKFPQWGKLQFPRTILYQNFSFPAPLFYRWQFMSEGADIGFGIYLKTKAGARQHAGDMTEVYVNQRYNAHLVPEDDSLTCTEPGICKYA